MADVSKKAAFVLNGFAELEYEDRKAIMKVLQEYQENIDHKKRKEIIESFNIKAGLPLGPTGANKCPCCGK